MYNIHIYISFNIYNVCVCVCVCVCVYKGRWGSTPGQGVRPHGSTPWSRCTAASKACVSCLQTKPLCSN